MQPLAIGQITQDHVTGGFRCGEARLDRFLTKHALFNDTHNVCRVFVAWLPPSMEVIGYYTLSNASVEYGEWPKPLSQGLPRFPLPAILLGRMATHADHQRKLIGTRLVLNAFERALRVLEHTSWMAMIVDAKNETLVDYYQRFGFRGYDTGLRLYVSTAQVRATLNQGV